MKRLCLFLIMLLVVLSCVSCTQELRPEPLDAAEVKNITASTAIYSNYLYVITDEEGIAELVELYNGLRYVPTDEVRYIDLLGDTFYRITYYSHTAPNSAEPTLTGVSLSPKGYVYFTDYTQKDDPDAEMPVYRLTSTFDEEYLKSLLKKYDSFSQEGENSFLSEISTDSSWEIQ